MAWGRKKKNLEIPKDVPLNLPVSSISTIRKPTPKISRHKEIRERKLVQTSVCVWCDGRGSTMGSWHMVKCTMCKGTGGKFEYQMILVRTESTS